MEERSYLLQLTFDKLAEIFSMEKAPESKAASMFRAHGDMALGIAQEFRDICEETQDIERAEYWGRVHSCLDNIVPSRVLH